MRTSPAGLRLLREREGERLTAYKDSVGVWTIGVGVTEYEDGTPVRPGDTITAERSEELLQRLIVRYEDAVNSSVTEPLTQPQFDSLVSIAWNIGIGAFRSSTLVKRLNAGDYAGAADQFLRWKYAGGRPILLKRRQAERAQFLSELPAVAPEPVPADNAPNFALSAQPLDKPMAPVLAALLPTVVSMIPELAKLFSSGSEVAERNIKAAERVAEVVVAATGEPNLQGAVERMEADPQALQAARDAVRREWFDLQSRSVADARKFVTEYGQTKNVRTVIGKFTFPELLSLVFIGLASLGVGYLMVSRQLTGELLGGVVTLMLIGGWTEIRKFWFGLGSPEGEQQRREP